MTDFYEISLVQKFCIITKILMHFLPIMTCTLGIIIDSNICFEKNNRVVAAEAGQAAGTLVFRIDYYT